MENLVQVFHLVLKTVAMGKYSPSCYGKCKDCFFYYINGCVALPGEDCFVKINDNQANLIINNQKRFDVPEHIASELTRKFALKNINSEY